MAETNVYIDGKLQPRLNTAGTGDSAPILGPSLKWPGASLAMLRTALIDLQELHPDDWREVLEEQVRAVSE